MNAFFGGSWSGMAMISDLDRHVIDRFLAAPASRFAIILSQVVRAGHHRCHPGADPAARSGSRSACASTAASLGWLVVFAAAALLAMAFAGFSHGIALIVRREASMIAAANFVGLPLMFLSAILIPPRRCRTGSQADLALQPRELGRSRRAERDRRRRPLGRERRVPLLLLAAIAVTSLFATWCFRAYQRSI